MIKNPYEWRTIFTHTHTINMHSSHLLLYFCFVFSSMNDDNRQWAPWCPWQRSVNGKTLFLSFFSHVMSKKETTANFSINQQDIHMHRWHSIASHSVDSSSFDELTKFFFYRNLKDWLWLITTSLLFDDAKRKILLLLLLLWLSFLYIFFAFFFYMYVYAAIFV